METNMRATGESKGMIWTGRVISALPALLLLFSGVVKLAKPASVVTGFHDFGYPESLLIPLGIVEIACTLVYLFPRTSVLGAILMTGYLGGAVATNVRLLNPAFVAPVICGVFVWLGLFLRDQRLRQLLLERRRAAPAVQRENVLV
ncbi:MAG TPA: DoxX family protein [Tepidisphaeraceae bacterium]|nr:DoxX family protein [Tepidisphaeraceae bacterium]